MKDKLQDIVVNWKLGFICDGEALDYIIDEIPRAEITEIIGDDNLTDYDCIMKVIELYKIEY